MADVSPADVMGDVDGAAGEPPGAAHAAAEGHESIDGSSSSVMDALLSTSPSPRLEDVESPFDLQHGGAPRISRGIQKMTGFEGMPALVDLVVGALELYLQNATGGEQQNDVGAGVDTLPAVSEDFK